MRYGPNGGTILKLFLLVVVFSEVANARMQYALQNNNNDCTTCHYTPVGGGPRNENGKLFQNRFFKTNPFLVQDYVSADFRTLYYRPEKPEASKGGMGVMSGTVAGHLALDKEKKVHLVIESNIGGFAAAPLRDTYVRYDFNGPGDKNWNPSILVGRFRAPFGVISDEHRTYTRLQSGTRWYDFETGAMASFNPGFQWHIDLAAVNGQQNSGQGLNQGGAEYWGGVFNLRYMPGPILLGLSYKYHDTQAASPSQAISLYSVLSLSRATHFDVPLTLILEGVEAEGFSSILNQGLVSDPAYASSLTQSRSRGALARLEWQVLNTLYLVYKYDWLLPDQAFRADYYERHGAGVRWNFAPYSQLIVRTEWARASHPSENSKAGLLSQDASFAILEVSF